MQQSVARVCLLPVRFKVGICSSDKEESSPKDIDGVSLCLKRSYGVMLFSRN